MIDEIYHGARSSLLALLLVLSAGLLLEVWERIKRRKP
jgi:hypothetical protein